MHRRCGSISTAHCPLSGTTGCYQPKPGSPSYNASLPVYMCVCVCLCVCLCVSVCVRPHPANNASLHVSPMAPLTFLIVSLSSESRFICSRHIYRADLCLLRDTHTHTHTQTHTLTHCGIILMSVLVMRNLSLFNQFVGRHTHTCTQRHTHLHNVNIVTPTICIIMNLHQWLTFSLVSIIKK